MVDPITAGLAGIALVTKITEQIKSGINAYNSVAELGGQIDALFIGERQCQRARNNKAGKIDPFNTETVAKEVIDHKLAQEKLREVATLIDLRFGHGTWAGILAERSRRIREAREAAAQAAKAKRQRMKDIEQVLVIIGWSLMGMAAIIFGSFLTHILI